MLFLIATSPPQILPVVAGFINPRSPFISKLFNYLDKFYTKQNNVPKVKKTLYLEFNDSKYKKLLSKSFNVKIKLSICETLLESWVDK